MSSEITFGSWLKQRRREQGITSDELADLIGFSTISLLKIEAGERRPSRQIAELLAERFHIPPDEIEPFITFARLGRAFLPPSESEVARRSPWRAAHLHRSNLPSALTALLGRDSDEAAIRALLLQPKVRLLTLTGAPGIGKTRLALQVASGMAEHFDDGVFLIELAPISDPDLVIPTVARVLGLKETSDLPVQDQLLTHVRERRMLLVMDNFEHLLDVAPVVVKWLEVSPWLKVLVTSREALHVRGERRFDVPPLDFPAADRLPPREILEEYPAVELFVERAQAVTPDFELTEANAADVVAICARLEGLPLAIELAAAYARFHTPQAILSRLENRLALVARNARDLPLRHQTLSAAIAWSYGLLNPEEQTLFRWMGVFADGFTPEAAAEVGGKIDPQRLPPVLESLVDRSLLKVMRSQEQAAPRDERRLMMLETIREYALEQLKAHDELQEANLRHALYFLHLAEDIDFRMGRNMRADSLDRLQAEHSNLRAALAFLLSNTRSGDLAPSDRVEMALRLCQAVYLYWRVRGYWTEGREWISAALKHADRLAYADGDGDLLKLLRARSRDSLGRLAYAQGDNAGARQLFEASLLLFRELGDRAGIVNALNNLGIDATDGSNFETATAFFAEAVTLARDLGDKYLIARTLNNMANNYRNLNDLAAARRYYEESRTLFLEIGDKSTAATPLSNLGLIALDQKDYAAARRYQDETVALARELGDKSSLVYGLAFSGSRLIYEEQYEAARAVYAECLHIAQEMGHKLVLAMCFEGLAVICERTGQPLEAARLWGAGERAREDINSPLPLPSRAFHEERIASAREQTTPEEFSSAWAEGHSMPVEQAADYASTNLLVGS